MIHLVTSIAPNLVNRTAPLQSDAYDLSSASFAAALQADQPEAALQADATIAAVHDDKAAPDPEIDPGSLQDAAAENATTRPPLFASPHFDADDQTSHAAPLVHRPGNLPIAPATMQQAPAATGGIGALIPRGQQGTDAPPVVSSNLASAAALPPLDSKPDAPEPAISTGLSDQTLPTIPALAAGTDQADRPDSGDPAHVPRPPVKADPVLLSTGTNAPIAPEQPVQSPSGAKVAGAWRAMAPATSEIVVQQDEHTPLWSADRLLPAKAAPGHAELHSVVLGIRPALSYLPEQFALWPMDANHDADHATTTDRQGAAPQSEIILMGATAGQSGTNNALPVQPPMAARNAPQQPLAQPVPEGIERLKLDNAAVSVTVTTLGAGLEIIVEPRHPLEVLDRSLARLVDDMRQLGYALQHEGFGTGHGERAARQHRLAFTPAVPGNTDIAEPAPVARLTGNGRVDLRL